MSQLQRITIALNQLQENQISLTQEQKHYLLRVLRLQDGDKFIAMDGQGLGWVVQVVASEAQIIEPFELLTELPVAVTLAIALPKGNGFDDVVRACTEIGVSCIAPVTSERALHNPSSQKMSRWRRIATEAAEQSERAFVPSILSPVSFSSFLSSDLSLSAQSKFICEARGNYPHLLNCLTKEEKNILLAIGPEGGWTDKELASAINAGYQAVSLGKRILRAITAPMVALSIVAAGLESLLVL